MEELKKYIEIAKKEPGLLFVMEQILRKPLTPREVGYVGEWLFKGYSAEDIEYVFEYAISNNKKSFSYINVLMEDEYLKAQNPKKDADETEIYNIYSLWSKVIGRPLKTSEKKLIEAWNKSGVPLSELIIAYGITMKKCDNFVFPYFEAIVNNRAQDRNK